MKIIFIIVMAVALCACGHHTSKATDADSSGIASGEITIVKALAADCIGKEYDDSLAHVLVSVEWPTADNDSLSTAVRRFICEEVAASITQEGKPKVHYTTDGKALVTTTADNQYQELSTANAQAQREGFGFGMVFEYSCSIKKEAETPTYVTILTTTEGFLGGAHGYATCSGQTFSKGDGRRIGYTTKYNSKTERFEIHDQTLFAKGYTPELGAIIKDGVKDYFKDNDINVPNDDDLMGMLQNVEDVNRIPMPQYPPYFTPQGLQFVYQQYEIGPYAMGMVIFTVPYDKIKTLLSPGAAKLIE